MMNELYEKMINESVAALQADVDVISANRYKDFKITDAKPYADAVAGMTCADGQAKSVIDLHKKSVESHYKVLTSVAETIRPEDDPFIEHYQTPPILEILCEEDGDFADSMATFIQAIADSETLITKESVRRYGGFYGPTCVVDFALMPGSTSNVVNQILKTIHIPVMHKQAILSAKSWGMNTSYGIGDAFANAIEAGATDIGENKVQEILDKYDRVKPVRWHLIGHLQTNKVKKILPLVDMIQSVDSLHLAEAISKEAQKCDINANILLEVNIGDEESKTGFDKVEFMESLEAISLLPNITVKGIMTIPPICDNDLLLEKYFSKMNDYYNEIKGKNFSNFDFQILSMGMSGDFYQAILHGSNLVRVGSAIFGARIYK